MNKKLKLISAISIMLMFSSALGITAYADEITADGDNYGDYSSSYVEPEPEPGISDIGGEDTSDIGGDTSSSYIEVDPDNNVVPDDSSNYNDFSPSYDDYSSSSVSDYYSDYNNESSYNDYYSAYSDSNSYSSSYAEGGQTYVESSNTNPTAALYDVKEKIDSKELNSNDWNDIANSLKNASESDDSDDFSFIQKNTSSGDNGNWMLFAGIGCLVLSIAGIVYVVVSTIRSRKLAASGNGSNRTSGNTAVAAAGSYRKHNGDYGDGYSSGTTRNRKKASRSSKFDTADVKLPKDSHTTGGKRYK